MIDGLANLDDSLRAQRFSPHYGLITFGVGASEHTPWSGDIKTAREAIENQPMSPSDENAATLAGLVKATSLRYRNGA